MATKYTIQTQTGLNGEWMDAEKPRSVKNAAVALAVKICSEQRVAVRVLTGTGTEVFSDVPASHGRRQSRTPRHLHAKPYFRNDENRSTVAAPGGWEICYAKPRRGLALIRSTSNRAHYAIMNTVPVGEHAVGSIMIDGISTTRGAQEVIGETNYKVLATASA